MHSCTWAHRRADDAYAARYGATSFCISRFVKLGMGLPQTRSAPEAFRSTASDESALPVQETITARRAALVRASNARLT